MATRFAVIPKTHRGWKAGVEGETDLDGTAVIDLTNDGEVEWFFSGSEERAVALAKRLNEMPEIVSCKTCGGVVTSGDPVKFPYCRSCFYVGSAAEDLRSEQLYRFRLAFPDANVGIDHTGGGCFWLSIRFDGSDTFYVLTDGEAGLPSDDDGKPVYDGWGYVGRYSMDEASADFDGTELLFTEEALGYPAAGYSDDKAIEVIRADIAARTAAVAEAVEQAKEEILAEVARGRIPADVAGFSDLHDFCDANEFGGLCDDAERADWDTEHANRVQDGVHQWIVAGGLTSTTN